MPDPSPQQATAAPPATAVPEEEWSQATLERIVAEIQSELPAPAQTSLQANEPRTHDAQPTAPAVEADIWRDTGLRFLGYANEIGEGFRPIVPRLVLPSYGVAVAYVLADTVTKYQAAATARAEAAAEASGTPSPSAVAADTLTWQMFASVLLPGLAINRTVWFTRQAVEAMPSRLPQALPLRAMLQNPMARRWLPTVVGLATIPFIIQPIDHFVHRQMDRTVRKWLNTPKHFVWE